MRGTGPELSTTYNAVVIGAGTAGLVVAAATAGLGGKVALVERGPMGGDCLNFGCVPSKALISSARIADRIRHADTWGLQAREPEFVFRDVITRVRARRGQIAPHDSQERFQKLGVEVFRGEASFLSPHEVRVGEEILRGARIVIATGTSPALPDIGGLSDIPYFTNETIFDDLDESPRSMIVLGGGPIGCELAQAFARLGVKVTLVWMNSFNQWIEQQGPAGLVLFVAAYALATVLFFPGSRSNDRRRARFWPVERNARRLRRIHARGWAGLPAGAPFGPRTGH